MELLAVLVATFVLSLIAGFGWRTGSVAARVVWKLLGRQRNTSKAAQGARDTSEAPRIKTHEADEPAREQRG